MYPLNNAQWSLLWEYVANILYALVIRRFSRMVLGVFVALSAVLTVMLCLNMDVFGVLAERTNAAYTVIGGWSIDPCNLLIAVSRLFYPFFCGLLLSRLFTGADGGRKVLDLERLGVKSGFGWCALVVAVLLVMPRVGGADAANYWMNGVYEAVVILLVFPGIIVIGAGSKLKGPKGESVCRFLGEISYPLYVTHYPLIYAQMSWASAHADLPAAIHVFVAACFFVLAIGVAYASYRLYDMPVREWLRRKWLK